MLRKLVGSTFDVDGQRSPSYINVLIRFSYTALFALIKSVKLLLSLAICPDFRESSSGRK